MADGLPALKMRRMHGNTLDKSDALCNCGKEQYTDEEEVFLRAVDKFRRVNGVSYATNAQVLWILRELGYRKVAVPCPVS